MKELKKRYPIKCTRLFKELAIEISRQAGFAHLKNGQTYERKKGFSNLLESVTESGEIVIGGNYKSEMESLYRHISNHNINLAQIVKSIANETFIATDGKTHVLKKYIAEYQQASTKAYDFIKEIIQIKPLKTRAKLDILEDLKKAAQINTHEIYFTFVASPNTQAILSRLGNIREAAATHLASAYVVKKDLVLTTEQSGRLAAYTRIFEHFNSLVTKINTFIKQKQKIPAKGISEKLGELTKEFNKIGTQHDNRI